MNSKEMAPTALIFAAGKGKRYRNLKQLAEIKGKPLIQHVIDTVQKIDWKFEPVLVLGYKSDRIRDSIDTSDVKVAENPQFARGLSTSMKNGVKACSTETTGYLFFLADMPLISPEDIRAVLARARSGYSLVAPSYHETRGFPVYLDRCWKEDILDVTGDMGAREIIKNNQEKLSLVSTENRGVIMDIDEKEDLKRVKTYITEGSEIGL